MISAISCLHAFELQREGQAVIVDLRTPQEFAQGHSKDAISIPYSSKGLSERLGVALPTKTPLVLVISDTSQVQEAESQLSGSEFPIVGMLDGGFKAWRDSALPTELLREVPIQQLEKFAQGQKAIVLDVREPMEWETGHVPGALLVALGSLRQHLGDIPKHGRIAVICEAGIRSSTAASILQAEGFTQVSNVAEGTGGYRRAGLPLQYPQGT